MNLRRLYIYSILSIGLISLIVVHFTAKSQNLFEDMNDEFIRLNPELADANDDFDTNKKYPFIRYDLNYIDLNGDDWTVLADKLEQSRVDGEFTIVHIGDSHIQADGNSGTTRALFQNSYGNSGRGLIIPFKLAGTNQPRDYTITSSSRFAKATLMRQPWAVPMGFTGVALRPESENFSFDITSQDPCGYFTIYGTGDINVRKIESNGENVKFEVDKSDGITTVSLEKDCNNFHVELSGVDATVFGFDLRNDSNGVLYHAIGNNGAACASYSKVPEFGKSISALSPDLIILSLGTNESFGRLDAKTFTSQLSQLVTQLKQQNPEAKFLLVTPSECQKSVSGSASSRRGKKSARSYQINENVVLVRNLILEFARKNHIPVYDFYAIAGGEGASNDWLRENLLNTDRIHRTWAGYRLDGTLMYQALTDALGFPRLQLN